MYLYVNQGKEYEKLPMQLFQIRKKINKISYKSIFVSAQGVDEVEIDNFSIFLNLSTTFAIHR
jgi:hypothetical protein